MSRVKELFEKFHFEYLKDEGCYIKKVYDCNIKYNNDIAIASHAYGIYCDVPKSFSRFHKLEHDELWQYYEGGKLKLYILYPNGDCETVVLGRDINNNEQLYKLVPAGAWQAGELYSGEYVLFGCTLAPAFEPSIFKLRNCKELAMQYPEYKDIINRL